MAVIFEPYQWRGTTGNSSYIYDKWTEITEDYNDGVGVTRRKRELEDLTLDEILFDDPKTLKRKLEEGIFYYFDPSIPGNIEQEEDRDNTSEMWWGNTSSSNNTGWI